MIKIIQIKLKTYKKATVTIKIVARSRIKIRYKSDKTILLLIDYYINTKTIIEVHKVFIKSKSIREITRRMYSISKTIINSS